MGDALSTLLAAVRSASSGGVALAPRVPVQGGPVDGALNFTGGVGAAPNAVTGQSDVSIPTGPAGTVLGTNSSGVVTYVPTGGLFYSPVDVGVGYGADGTSGIIEQIYEDSGVYYGQTYGVGFAVTQAGHFCAGARFWWGFDGRAHPLLISLWQHGGTKLATWGASGGSGVVQTVSYGAPIALVPGVPYAITIFDSTPSTSNLSLAPPAAGPTPAARSLVKRTWAISCSAAAIRADSGGRSASDATSSAALAQTTCTGSTQACPIRSSTTCPTRRRSITLSSSQW